MGAIFALSWILEQPGSLSPMTALDLPLPWTTPPRNVLGDELPEAEYCDQCDGVGWTEGGTTLQTTCSKCKGTGVLGRKT